MNLTKSQAEQVKAADKRIAELEKELNLAREHKRELTNRLSLNKINIRDYESPNFVLGEN